MKSHFAILFIVVSTHYLFAQTDAVTLTARKSYWFDIGLGWGGQGSAFDIGLSYEMTPRRIISFHYSSVVTDKRCYDYFLFIPVADYPLGEDADAYDLSYGVLKKGKAGIITFSAGLSYVKIQSGTGSGPPIGFDYLFSGSSRPVDYELDQHNTFGVALRAQFIPSLRWGGLGISPYLNINPRYTFGSITIQLALGRLRPKGRS